MRIRYVVGFVFLQAQAVVTANSQSEPVADPTRNLASCVRFSHTETITTLRNSCNVTLVVHVKDQGPCSSNCAFYPVGPGKTDGTSRLKGQRIVAACQYPGIPKNVGADKFECDKMDPRFRDRPATPWPAIADNAAEGVETPPAPFNPSTPTPTPNTRPQETGPQPTAGEVISQALLAQLEKRNKESRRNSASLPTVPPFPRLSTSSASSTTQLKSSLASLMRFLEETDLTVPRLESLIQSDFTPHTQRVEAEALLVQLNSDRKLAVDIAIEYEKRLKSPSSSLPSSILAAAQTIVGKWRDENSVSTFAADKSFQTTFDTGKTSKGMWSIEQDILTINFESGSVLRQRILTISQNEFQIEYLDPKGVSTIYHGRRIQ